MSKPEIDNDGFQKVFSKRFSKRKSLKIPQQEINYYNDDIDIDIEKSKRQIANAIDDIKASTYFEKFHKSVSTVLLNRNVEEIVCLGLGHIGECSISRYQLALLLCLKQIYNPRRVVVHDPVFYKSECVLLRQLDLEILEQNSEGCYIIGDSSVTVVYLPHCPKQLTNNFLWSNWGLKLQNCILICNSFTSLNDSQPNRILFETVTYIHQIFPHTKEITLENNFKYTDIFNDTSVHAFPIDLIEKVDPHFWLKGDKPNYKDTEEFITNLMVEKLNI